jgi:acyl transferase domain-containing protein/thioesterase domain-containing protein
VLTESAAVAAASQTEAPEVSTTDVAVVGRALRVPGARTVSEFWENLRRGAESIRRLTDDELRAAGVPPALLADPNYVKAAAPLDGIDLFDAGFFGFSPREASIMDPQHRHFLEVAWEALEDAGHVPESFDGRIGVFAGSGMNAYMPYHLFTNPKLMAASGLFLVRHTGNDKDFLTTRVSYLFDLRGPSVNIQTACSTSLVAIHAAAQSLISHECDMALAGGVTIELPHGHGYLYQEGEILSPDGHCRAFDRKSKGTVFGSGAGVVVLRRLQDALAEGNTIYAVVKGSAVNNDGGRKVGYLAPSVDGQAEAVAEAINISTVPADSITYVECHGTGTPVGDPIEITGLTHAFRSLTDRTNFCAVGSVKTNIGHLDTAAGVASFVKVVEMLRHQTMVPNLHLTEPNPEVDWATTPFYVNTKTAEWQSKGPRRASINSLGVGGTNAHVVLEEAPAVTAARPSDTETVFLLSARSNESLDRATRRLADCFEQDETLDLRDAAFTLAVGRRRFSERRAVVANSREAAIAALRSNGPWAGASSPASATKVAFLFPGGGAQYPGMAADLYKSEPVFRALVDRCLELLQKHEGLDLRPLMFPAAGAEGAAAAQLVKPSFALPALLTIELAVASLLRSWRIAPVAMLGHSMGEYAAAHLAGVFSLKDVLSVVACRGRLFETLPEGAMLSVPLPASEVASELLPGLSFAAINGPGLCLVSGEVGGIQQLEARLAARGVEAKRLAITVAAHSPMLEPILGTFEAYLRTLKLSEPTMPFVSNVTGTWIRPEEARDPLYWVRHLRQPVRFAEGLSTLVAKEGYALLEVGPGRTLTSLAQAHPDIGSARGVFTSLRHPQDPITDRHALFTAVGRLWSVGVDPDWQSFFGPGRRRVSLPTYSFDHKRHWIEPGDGFFLRPETGQALEKNADRAQWTYRPVWRASEPSELRREAARNILVFDDGSSLSRQVVLELRAAGHTVECARAGDAFGRAEDGAFVVRATSRDDHAALLRELAKAGRTPAQIAHLWALGNDESLDPKAAEDRYFFPLVSLSQALIDEEPEKPVELVVVTNGAEAAGSDNAPRFPLKALVQGPSRVAPKEMPFVSCRTVDLPALVGSNQQIVRTLVSELELQTSDQRVALRDGERFVEAYERWPLQESGEAWPIPQHAVVLITGGLGGIALAMAERMALTSQARFILLGRTPLPARETWPDVLAKLDHNDAIAARIRSIQAIEAAGGEVAVVTGDVSDREAMVRAVAEGEARFGSITGAIHAAGSIDDAPLHSKERERLEAVLSPKVSGAVALIDALRGRALQFVVLFSSTSAALAPAGQADYVAANAFLDAYAQRLASDGLPVRAVQWGAWREVGMAVAALAPPRIAGAERVTHPLLQTRATRSDGATVFTATVSPQTHWVLDEHRVRAGEPVMPGTGYVEMMRAALDATALAHPAIVELTDVAFTSPLIVPDKGSAVVETELVADADGFVNVTIRSAERRGQSVEHATGRGRLLTEWTSKTIDAAAIEARCTARRESFAAGESFVPQERLLAFGPRWKALRTLALGHDEAIARLELSDAHAADLGAFALHPALLDMATGSAFALLQLLPDESSLFVPLSYGKARIAQRLPQRLVSHVRVRPGSGEGVGVLDATFADEHGAIVAEIEGYVVKSVASTVLKGIRKPEAAASPLERWIEHGIRPDEGFDVLGRVLRQPGATRVLISPLDFHAMVAELRAPERHAAVHHASDAAPATAEGAASGEQDQPRDEIERRLKGIWQELLGVDAVRLQDGFFDLGGHSLIAVRLFARIRKTWGVDLPLATLFRAPTLEALAAAVRDGLGLTLESTSADSTPSGTTSPSRPAKAAWSPLVLIRKGGARRPFFCVHGAGGNLLNFRDFAERLNPDQPVYGLEARGVDGQQPPAASIEEMAEMYVSAIRTVQPHGPYLLGGYSGGGVVALEMARKLEAAGEVTKEVILLDTFHPATKPRKVGLREELREYAANGLQYTLKIFGGVVVRHTVWRYRNWRLASLARNGSSIPHELREWHVTTAFFDALRRHVPQVYSGHVTLFRASDTGLMYRHVGSRLGWDSELTQLDIAEVPGTHDTLVREPGVCVLASVLEELLRNASM